MAISDKKFNSNFIKLILEVEWRRLYREWKIKLNPDDTRRQENVVTTSSVVLVFWSDAFQRPYNVTLTSCPAGEPYRDDVKRL